MHSSGNIIPVVLIVLVLIAGVSLYFFLTSGVPIVLTPVSLENVSRGDPLNMDGKQIGRVTRADLGAPGKPEIHVQINKKYAAFINQTSVFTIANDVNRSGRKVIETKTCDPNRTAIVKGHQFTPMNRLKYSIACLNDGGLIRKLWESPLRSIVMDSIKTGGVLSEDTIQKLKELEKDKHQEFLAFMDDLEQNVRDMTPELAKQLDEVFGLKLSDKKVSN